ncbi:MAG: hypothetical protein HYU59_02320 [Magnetospirillum gryphiswaldense]|nr:hypothetical protein [Magnetospirillum gryphiswaldense]
MIEGVGSGDTLSVSVEVLGVETVNKGGLLRLQGIQVRRRANGQISVDSPCFRSGDGRWLPEVVLPLELGQAVADVVQKALYGAPTL